MLKIRLQKIGKKNDPSYRVVLVEHTTSPHGKFIELLGSYNTKLKEKKLNKERIGYWLTKGAQASPTIHNLLVDEKIITAEKVKAWKPKKKKGEEKPAAPAAPKTDVSAEAPAKAEETLKVEEPKKDIPAEILTEAKAEPASVPTPVVTTDEAREPKPHLPAEASAKEGETPSLDTQEKTD
jgi:small subunit ribosomal protein S16